MDEKQCPFCAETIKAQAVKCKHCGVMLDGSTPNQSNGNESNKKDSFLEKSAGWIRSFIGICFIFTGMANFWHFYEPGNLLMGITTILIGLIILRSFDKITDKLFKKKFSTTLKFVLVIVIFIVNVIISMVSDTPDKSTNTATTSNTNQSSKITSEN